MQKRFYKDREVLSFAFGKTVDHFGMWILADIIQVIATIMRLAGIVLVVGISGMRFFGTSFNNELMNSQLLDFSGFRISFKVIFAALLVYLLFEFIGGMIHMGIVRIAMDFYEKDESSFDRILSCARLSLSYFVATAIYYFICLFSCIFLIVPGIYFSLRLFFCILLIVPGIYFSLRLRYYREVLVDKNVGPLRALGISWDITKGAAKQIFVTMLLWGTFVIPLAVPPIGFLWLLSFFPFFILGNVAVYKALIQRND